ncbi:hypothetical protein RFH74_004523 [Klebsiella aerogenes]|nr:hypothetical protein [Klebsiella aerogenes]
MVTDITELAQREKFEAWWERSQHNGNPPRFGWSHWRDGEGYKVDDDDSELDGMWKVWKAASAELVETLEKAQTENTAGAAGMAESYETTISMLRSRIASLEESHAQVIQSRDHYKRMLEEGLEQLAEPRTITVKLPKLKMLEDYLAEVAIEERKQILNGVRLEFHRALTAAGIKWEAE